MSRSQPSGPSVTVFERLPKYGLLHTPEVGLITARIVLGGNVLIERGGVEARVGFLLEQLNAENECQGHQGRQCRNALHG